MEKQYQPNIPSCLNTTEHKAIGGSVQVHSSQTCHERARAPHQREKLARRPFFLSEQIYFMVGSLCNDYVLFPQNVLHKENNYFARHFLKYEKYYSRKICQHLMLQN